MEKVKNVLSYFRNFMENFCFGVFNTMCINLAGFIGSREVNIVTNVMLFVFMVLNYFGFKRLKRLKIKKTVVNKINIVVILLGLLVAGLLVEVFDFEVFRKQVVDHFIK